MSVSDNNKNRGTHGDSSFMLGRSRPSSENPPALAVGRVNRLYVCRSTAENIKRAEKFKYFKANERYILVISEDAPDRMAEITGDTAGSLTQQDWAWINAVGDSIKAEKDYEEFSRQSKEFIKRFEDELIKRKEGLENGGSSGDGTE